MVIAARLLRIPSGHLGRSAERTQSGGRRHPSRGHGQSGCRDAERIQWRRTEPRADLKPFCRANPMAPRWLRGGAEGSQLRGGADLAERTQWRRSRCRGGVCVEIFRSARRWRLRRGVGCRTVRGGRGRPTRGVAVDGTRIEKGPPMSVQTSSPVATVPGPAAGLDVPDHPLPPLPPGWTSLPSAFLRAARGNWKKLGMVDSLGAKLTFGSVLTRALVLSRLPQAEARGGSLRRAARAAGGGGVRDERGDRHARQGRGEPELFGVEGGHRLLDRPVRHHAGSSPRPRSSTRSASGRPAS